MNALLHLLVAFLLSLAGQKTPSSSVDGTTTAADAVPAVTALPEAAPADASGWGPLPESSASAKPTSPSTPVVPSTKPIVRPPSWPKPPTPKHPTPKACPLPPPCAGAIGFCPSYRCEDGVLVRQPNTRKPSVDPAAAL